MVKHVVKGEKWACSTPKAGKNKPNFISQKIFTKIREIIKETPGYISHLSSATFIEDSNMYKKQRIRTHPRLGISSDFLCLVRVFITDLILRHSAEAVETYSQGTENACVYKEFCNTKGI